LTQIRKIVFFIGVGIIAIFIFSILFNRIKFDFKFTGFFTRNKTLNKTVPLSQSQLENTSTITSTTSVITTTSILTTTTIESTISTTIPTTTEATTSSTTSTTSSTIALTSTIPILTGHVVFSEVFYNTPGNDDSQWIELYNPTPNSIDLSGLIIENNAGAYAIPNGISIDSNQYLIIAKNDTVFYDLYGFSPNDAGLTINLTYDKDVLRLRNDAGEIDMVAWGNYVSGWDLKADDNESIQRFPPDIDTDTPDDWISNAYPDPGV